MMGSNGSHAGDAGNQFMDVKEAYEILSDMEQRQKYDALEYNIHGPFHNQK